MKYRENAELHPLHHIVIGAFGHSEAQDGSSLVHYLGGGGLSGRGFEAYHTVAEDVLGYMTDQGHLYRDSEGWWRLKSNPSKPQD